MTIDWTRTVTAESRAAAALASHKRRVTEAIDAHVEAVARARGYGSAAALASYALSTVPEWAAEASAFVRWRDSVWVAALALLAEAESGGPVPSAEEALAALPEIDWPAA